LRRTTFPALLIALDLIILISSYLTENALRLHRQRRIEEDYLIRGRDSKQVTDESKTTAMDVIGFLCVSLGSSTVQLHDRLGGRRACESSDAGLSSQNGDRV
jgi:hypothetical protein